MFRKALLALVAIVLAVSRLRRAMRRLGNTRDRSSMRRAKLIRGSDRVSQELHRRCSRHSVRRNGVAEFPNVPVGFYDLRVSAAAYNAANAAVELRYGESRLDVRAVLIRPLHPNRLGSRRSTIDVQNRVLRRDAGLGRLSVTLADLLNTLGGAQVRLSSNGSLLGYPAARSKILP